MVCFFSSSKDNALLHADTVPCLHSNCRLMKGSAQLLSLEKKKTGTFHAHLLVQKKAYSRPLPQSSTCQLCTSAAVTGSERLLVEILKVWRTSLPRNHVKWLQFPELNVVFVTAGVETDKTFWMMLGSLDCESASTVLCRTHKNALHFYCNQGYFDAPMHFLLN